MKKYIFLLALILLQGCSINQKISKIPKEIDTLCIVEDKSVRESFLEQYAKNLKDIDVNYKIMLPFSDKDDCKYFSTYTAKWSWDFTIYMAYANIDVYEEEQKIASATYDARSGSGNLGKFIDADEKVKELVYGLFGKPYEKPIATDIKKQPGE